MLTDEELRLINEETLMACLEAHGRAGFSGELVFEHNELLTWRERSNVHVDQQKADPEEVQRSIRQKAPSVAAWMKMRGASLEVSFRLGVISKTLIRSEHRG